MSDLNCLLDKDTLRNLIIAFKDSYNQILENESEEENENQSKENH